MSTKQSYYLVNIKIKNATKLTFTSVKNAKPVTCASMVAEVCGSSRSHTFHTNPATMIIIKQIRIDARMAIVGYLRNRIFSCCQNICIRHHCAFTNISNKVDRCTSVCA